MPAISVIVPVYKAENYLADCVESLLSQTFSDFEFIICVLYTFLLSKSIIFLTKIEENSH